MTPQVPNRGLEWTNLILGACLVCAAFAFGALPAAAWNAGIVGSLIACSSAVALYRYGNWAEWTNVALGAWAILAPFTLGFVTAAGPMWTHFVVGICVTAIAILQLMSARVLRT